MNVVEAQSALLSDYEVLCLLRERDGPAAGGGVDKKADAAAMDLTALATSSTTGSSHLPQNVATVEFEVGHVWL